MHCKCEVSTVCPGELLMKARLPIFFSRAEVEANASSTSSSEEADTQMKRREVGVSGFRNLDISERLASSVMRAERWSWMEEWMYSCGDGGLPMVNGKALLLLAAVVGFVLCPSPFRSVGASGQCAIVGVGRRLSRGRGEYSVNRPFKGTHRSFISPDTGFLSF